MKEESVKGERPAFFDAAEFARRKLGVPPCDHDFIELFDKDGDLVAFLCRDCGQLSLNEE